MIFKRGTKGTWCLRFRFGNRVFHESTHSQSKTLARDVERQRHRELEERINGIRKCGLTPTFGRAACEWQTSCTRV